MKLIRYRNPERGDANPVAIKVNMDQASWADGIVFGFDVESTGPNPLEDRIVSAAIVIDYPNSDPKIFKWIINPDKEIMLEATAVHGLTNEYVQANGQSELEGILDIINTLDSIKNEYGLIPLIMVNCIFDLTMLFLAAKRLGINDDLQIDFPIIDTLVLDRDILDKYRSGRRTLSSVSAAYNIVIRKAHQADGDVITSIKLARKMAEVHSPLRYADLEDLQIVQRNAAAQRAREFQEYRRSDGEDITINGEWPIIKGGN